MVLSCEDQRYSTDAHVPVLAGERLEALVALLGVAAGAGLVALAADEQQLLAADRHARGPSGSASRR